MPDSIRNILPAMVDNSNNSRMTNEMAVTLVKKLTPAEQGQFKRWLQLVSMNQNRKHNRKRH